MTAADLDPFDDGLSLDERRYGRLRELCLRDAWTIKDAAWIICGFDRVRHQKGDSRHESDGWFPLRGWSVPRQPPETPGLNGQARLDHLRERLEDRLETDQARHNNICWIALRLAGLLNGGMVSAHPPARILEVACRNGMVPPWLEYARADPKITTVLPRDIKKGRIVRPPAGETEEERLAEAEKQWPNLTAELKWKRGGKSSAYSKLKSEFPYWPYMLVYAFEYRDRSNSDVASELDRIIGFSWGNQPMAPRKVEQWRKDSRVEVALKVLRFRLLGFEGASPHSDLPDLDAFLGDAEQDSVLKAESS